MNGPLKYFRISISGLLIGLYATVFIGWDMLHAHVHQEEAVLHTAQVEKDSCHRSIFHGEQDAHKSHLAEYKHCASCHVVSQPAYCKEAVISLPDFLLLTEKAFNFSSLAPQTVTFLFSSRAPPSIV